MVFAGVGIWFSPIPWELSVEAWHLFALFFSAILGVLLNAFPILLSALFAMVIGVFTGTLTPKTAFSGFSQSFMLLILAAFLVAKAVIKSGLGKRLALLLIRRFGKSTLGLGYCIFVTDALLGPAIPSNLARSGILYPIIHALALDTGSFPGDASRKRSGSFLMLCGMVSLTVSSAMWLTAMGGNPIAAGIAGRFGVDISFGNWFLAASLPSLAGLILLPRILYRIFPPEVRQTPTAQAAAAKDLQIMGPMSRPELITASVFLGMIVLWGFAAFLKINLAIVALSGLAILILTKVYRLEDFRAEGGDALETYIWFSILYMISSQLNELGFMSTLGIQISSLLGGLNWMLVYLFLLLLYVLIHYFFVSQTAHLLALYAVFLEVGSSAGVPIILLAYMLAFATNFFSSITPQGSSGNVIFVGSGYLEIKEVFRYGGIVTLINLLLYALATPWVLWVVG